MKPNQQNTQQNTTTAPAWTPGPWHRGCVTSSIGQVIATEKEGGEWPDRVIAQVYPHTTNPTEEMAEEIRANARLIAAAPEMAAFIQAIVRHCDSPLADCVNVKNLGDRARAILARINGEGGGV